MSIVTISNKEFNDDVDKARKNALEYPVMITDCGNPTDVLLSIEHYLRITINEKNILDLLTTPSAANIELVASVLDKSFLQPVDLT